MFDVSRSLTVQQSMRIQETQTKPCLLLKYSAICLYHFFITFVAGNEQFIINHGMHVNNQCLNRDKEVSR